MMQPRSYWNPWRELAELQNEVNRLFSPFRGAPFPRRAEYPPVNVWQSPSGVILTAEVPGYDADSLDVTVMADTVTIRAKGRNGQLKERESYRRQERPLDAFERTIELPVEVDPQKTEARYEKGVLTLTLSRPEEHKPKKIKMKTES